MLETPSPFIGAWRSDPSDPATIAALGDVRMKFSLMAN
jgi:hypothetical protein